MKTYDQPNGNGKLLGSVDQVALISPGTANTLTLTVIGIAKSVTLQPLPNQTLLLGGPTTGFTMVGNFPEFFYMTLKDPDGNTILNGQPAVTEVGGNGPAGNHGIAVVYANTVGNIVAFLPESPTQYQPNTNGYQSISVAVENPDGTQATAAPISMRDENAILVASGTGISLFEQDGTPVPLAAGSYGGLTQPSAIVYDFCSWTSVIADQAANTLKYYNLDGSNYAYPVGPFGGLNAPVGMAADYLNRSIVTANAGDNSVRFYNSAGPIFTVTSLGASFTPSAIACLNLCTSQLVLSASANGVQILNPAGLGFGPIGTFPGVNQPSAAIESGPPMNQVYIANQGNDSITVYDERGNPLAVAGSFPGLSHPVSLAFNAANQLLALNARNNSVSEYDLQGNRIALPAGAFPALSQARAIYTISPVQCFG